MSIPQTKHKQWTERTNATGPTLPDTESMFGKFFESTADAVWLLDPTEGRLCQCNRTALDWLGLNSEAELLGRRLSELAADTEGGEQASACLIQQAVTKALAEGSHRFEWVCRRADGSELPLDVVLTRVQNGNGPLLLAVSRDISERRREKSEILRLNETLEQRVTERTRELLAANEQLKSEIAERARAEVLLRDSEARARILVDHAPEAIVVFDGQTGIFVDCNPNASQLYGLPREKLIGKHPAELSPVVQPDGRSSMDSAREKIKLALSGQVPTFEWTHRHSSGRLIPCEVRLLRLPGGNRNLIRGSIIDNTERRRRERVQQATYAISEAAHMADDLEQLYAQMHRIVKSLMPAENFYIALYDPATELLNFPYHVDEFTPQPAPCPLGTGLTGYVFRYGKPLLVNEEMTSRKRYVNEKVTFEGFADILYEESGVPAAIWLGVPLSCCGKTLGVMAVQDYRDPAAYGEAEKQLLGFVAEQVALAIQRKRVEESLRESEARFSTAFHAIPLFLTISRMRDGRFIEINEAGLRWSGYTREEAVGKSSAELRLWPNMADREKFWGELKTKGFLRDYECQLQNRAGVLHIMSVSAEVIDINGESHLLMVTQDISHRKMVEQELLKTLALEKELGQLRSNFISMVSHEFRTPLGVIQSSAEILEDYFDQLPTEERRDHLASIHKNTRRMAGLMEEVLLLGRFEAGKMDFKPDKVDLGGFVQRLANEIETATENRCEVKITKGDLGGEAETDERLLRHILTNLLTNSIKYSEPGAEVEFTISREGQMAVFTVRDHGVGIPREEMQWMFRAFYRASNVAGRSGTGLGLVIVKRCVDLHGGTIQLESELGIGTTVTVRLPVWPS